MRKAFALYHHLSEDEIGVSNCSTLTVVFVVWATSYAGRNAVFHKTYAVKTQKVWGIE